MSCSTSTWPSQAGPAPMPMVGIRTAALIRPGELGGNQLEHHRTGARLFERLGIFQQPGAGIGLPALNPVPAERVDRLRREAEVSHHRDADLHEGADRLGHVPAAFQLHAVGPALLQNPARIAERLGDRDLIGQERQIHEHERAVRTAAHRGGVVDHLIQRRAQRGSVTGDDLVAPSRRPAADPRSDRAPAP